MLSLLKKLVIKFVPGHIEDPGLFIRMIRSRNPAAWFTLLTTALGVLVVPFDILLAVFERRLYRHAPESTLPLVFVCGAPRTGTTLTAQVLIKNLSVSYFNNLTALFPRAPITVNRLFGRFIGRSIDYQSYYSKSTGFSGPNDAFYIWDRWMSEDETGMRCVLIADKKDEMAHFFGAYEQAFGKPLIAKNNSLNTQAKAVADALPNAYFICMTRDTAYLAQSLMQARKEIQGDVHKRLWVDNPDKSHVEQGDYVADVCDQAMYHERKIHEQQALIGAERFWIVPYEEFCAAPEKLVQRVSEQILKRPFPLEKIQQELKPFKVSNKITVDANVFEEIQRTLASMKGQVSVH